MHPKILHFDADHDEATPTPPSSIAARREAAPNLAPFGVLPSRSEIPSTQYPSHASAAMTNSSDRNNKARRMLPVAPPTSSPSITPFPPSNTSTTSANGSSILTLTLGTAVTGGASPSPGINSSSSQQSPVGGPSMYYAHNSHGSWPTPTAPGYNYSSTSLASGAFTRSNFNHTLASPQLPQYPGRTSASLANGEALPGTSTYQDHSAFPSPTGGGGGGGGSGGAEMNGGGGTNTGVNGGSGSFGSTLNPQPHGTTSSGLTLPILGGPGQTGPQPSPSQSSMGGHATGPEGHIYRSPSTSGYYPPVSSPQQGSFPYASQPGPSQTVTAGPLSGRGPPLIPGIPSSMYSGLPQPHHMPPATYDQFPSTQGAIMSNVHHPNHPMDAMYSNPHQQYHMHTQVYLNNQQHQARDDRNDRPFKCNTCTQKFNRNHDLKRHSRIHLSVKPFPCNMCDKSFSRKDALKRHRLVKGCEAKEQALKEQAAREEKATRAKAAKEKAASAVTNSNTQRESPSTSDGDTTSPMVFKKEN